MRHFLGIKRIIGALILGLVLSLVAIAQTVTLRTWYSQSRGDHFTTTDPRWSGFVGDVRLTEGSGYVMIRIEGDVFDPERPRPAGTVPLYGFYNARREDNFITSDPRWTSRTEADGYTRFRLEGYIYPSAGRDAIPLISLFSPSREDNYSSSDPRLTSFLVGAQVNEATMSVEGGRYNTYRVEGHLIRPSGGAPSTRGRLAGHVDMHTHPMAHLGFGKKVIHGAPDVGSLIPAGTRDCNVSDLRATSIADALGHDNSTHGGVGEFDNRCGNDQRKLMLALAEAGKNSVHGSDKTGFPSFVHWPKWNDITHQQMWVDWIRRAHTNGGMRVMVALAVNNRTLAETAKGDPPVDDQASADLQIREIAAFVLRHPDFMELAFSAGDVRRIVGRGRLAVVIGVELDDLGNFASRPEATVTATSIDAEIERLHRLGVRYALPIHATNNRFGGTAAYSPQFTAANRVQTGRWMDLECSTSVGYIQDVTTYQIAAFFLRGIVDATGAPRCGSGQGQRNRLGLTELGRNALSSMMRRGWIIDVDHMSERAVDDAIAFARNFPTGWGYPLVSGHNGPRGPGGSERQLREDQLVAIRDLGGMLGLGWADQTPRQFRDNLANARRIMGDGRVVFGTDMNGLDPQLKPPSLGLRSDAAGPHPDGTRVDWTWVTGTRSWRFATDGAANYGMLPEVIQDIGNFNPDLRASMNQGAESFARVFERAEAARASRPIRP